MDALATATATASAVSTIGSHFMLDPQTFARGAELGFSGIDFYVTGRGGVLGEVDADVVSAGFAFFEPNGIRALWEAGRAVLPAADAAHAFAGCAAAWAEAHVPDDIDAARLAELAGAVAAAARPACAAVFAGWRALEVPTDPKAAAVHQLNALRELRLGLHAAAVLASGLTPLEALSIKTPHMVSIFGWSGAAEVTDDHRARWHAAEAATDEMIAHAYEVLDDADRRDLVELARALHDAAKG